MFVLAYCRSHDGFETMSDGRSEPKSGSKYASQKIVFDHLGQGVLNNAFEGRFIDTTCIWVKLMVMCLGASVVWQLSLPLMNGFNKYEAAIFSMQVMLPEDLLFLEIS